MRIILRSDASDSIGAGHIMRCLAIAEESILRGIPTYLVGEVKNLPWLRDRVCSLPKLIWIENPDDFLPNPYTDSLIIDSYSIPTRDSFIDVMNWYRVIAIIDEKTPNYEASILFHPGLDISWSKEKNIYYGPKYIPIRKAISRESSEENQKLCIIVVGGGTDFRNFVGVIADQLKDIDLEFTAHLFSNNYSLIQEEDTRFMLEPIGERLDYMAARADLILTTASTTCLEFVAREKAVGMFCAVENQSIYYKSLAKLELACPLGKFEGEHWEIDNNLLSKLIYSSEYRSEFRLKTRGVIDLLGAARILNRISAEYK